LVQFHQKPCISCTGSITPRNVKFQSTNPIIVPDVATSSATYTQSNSVSTSSTRQQTAKKATTSITVASRKKK
ncbi:hypothetical protein OESDEN_07558, partial [Oesophagostomum dentatum]